MCKHFTRPLAVLFATIVVLVAVGTSSANRLSASNRGIRIVWTEMHYTSERFDVRCPVTMEGSLHSFTIAKVANSLIGYITRAISGACEGGRVQLLTEMLPWHIRYESFSGTLPRPSGIKWSSVSMSWLVEPTIGVSCLYRSTNELPAVGNFSIG